MPLGVNAHPGAWLDGVAVAGQDLRLQIAGGLLTGLSPSGSTGIAARPGIRYGTGSPLFVGPSSGMNITVNPGICFVQGTASATAGMYTCCLDTTTTLTVATSDPTNPRIDNVICQITDVGTSLSTTVVTLQTGTPAPSPVAPTLPANSFLLATVSVAANATTITSGNISTNRVFTVATGGILPISSTTGGLTGSAGMYAHDLGTGRLKVSDGSGNARAPKVSAIAPVYAYVTPAGSITIPASGANQLIGQVSVTVDGATELQLFCSWAGYSMNPAVAGTQVTGFFSLDGSAGINNVTPWKWRQEGTIVNVPTGGGNAMGFVTPSAGTHTIGWYVGQTAGNTQNVYMDVNSSSMLRVAAVPG